MAYSQEQFHSALIRLFQWFLVPEKIDGNEVRTGRPTLQQEPH